MSIFLKTLAGTFVVTLALNVALAVFACFVTLMEWDRPHPGPMLMDAAFYPMSWTESPVSLIQLGAMISLMRASAVSFVAGGVVLIYLVATGRLLDR